MSTKAIHIIVFTFLIGLGVVASPLAQATDPSFSVLYNFNGGSDSANPLNGFISDREGNLYGVASSGGSFGYGTVFELSPTNQETVLYSFAGGSDGANPQGLLYRDYRGNLYGTTYSGGTANTGTVFEITSEGVESVLYSFAGGTDGANPAAGLIYKAGNLYGTTTAGGATGNGTVFELIRPVGARKAWTEKILYSFGSSPDGSSPIAGVTFDKMGNLLGTTQNGGAYGYGTIFELAVDSNWAESIVHDFAEGSDGGVPKAGLTLLGGNLYGAASDGGDGNDPQGNGGTVFELESTAQGWQFITLYALPGWGISGSFRDVLVVSDAKIYGTTHCDGTNGAGSVYELLKMKGVWNYIPLYNFTGGDGQYSFSNLYKDKAGNLYGTTNIGGANGAGVVFKITM
jgi:uncharacterized repeat protein (TIGR03803 family)